MVTGVVVVSRENGGSAGTYPRRFTDKYSDVDVTVHTVRRQVAYRRYLPACEVWRIACLSTNAVDLLCVIPPSGPYRRQQAPVGSRAERADDIHTNNGAGGFYSRVYLVAVVRQTA